MKAIKLFFTILTIVVTISSCKKDTEVGPQGAIGATGPTGSTGPVNFHDTLLWVAPSNWIVTNPNFFYQTYSLPDFFDFPSAANIITVSVQINCCMSPLPIETKDTLSMGITYLYPSIFSFQYLAFADPNYFSLTLSKKDTLPLVIPPDSFVVSVVTVKN